MDVDGDVIFHDSQADPLTHLEGPVLSQFLSSSVKEESYLELYNFHLGLIEVSCNNIFRKKYEAVLWKINELLNDKTFIRYTKIRHI
jgi:hypothetical protein